MSLGRLAAEIQEWEDQAEEGTSSSTRPSKIRFLVFQTEQGDEGTVHLQGYLELRGTARVASVKRLLGSDRYHLEVRHGSQREAIDYCRKADSRVEGPWGCWGTPAQQGSRSDLEAIRMRIRGGATELQIADEYFPTWVRNYRALERFRGLVGQERLRRARPSTGYPAPVVEIHWGPTGTGKSRHVFETWPEAYLVPRAQGSVWFDGVSLDDETIVFDEFYSWIPYDLLLRVCDRHALQLPVKGGFVHRPPFKRVVFTSNQDPKRWYHAYEKEGMDRGAPFFRRVTDVWKYGPGGKVRDEVGPVILGGPTSEWWNV